jgi:mono/diheme cytochrome c family protein
VGYSIAPDVPPENRALLIERFEKGKVLFKANCSSCHGIFAAGQGGAPNFSTEQIDNYNANYIKGDQKNHMVARKLSQQQVDYILTFLRLRTVQTQ